MAEIGAGLVVLLGVGDEDGEDDAAYMADKILGVRIFPDGAGKFNHSVLDVQGEVLVVSQFTLYGDCRKGRRPSFTGAASRSGPPADCMRRWPSRLAESGLKVETGEFRAMMAVGIVNDGPVTILIDSKKVF